jgi:glycosyltransferase involved in cell wall biosynthesis
MYESSPRVLYLLGEVDPSAHWRVIRPVTRLEEAGCPVTWALESKVNRHKLGAYYDAVVLVRLCWPDHAQGREYVDSLKRQGLTVLYETDDDWFSEGSAERLHQAMPMLGTLAEYEQKRKDLCYALSLMDGVIVSSQGLAEAVRQHTDAPVQVVPNAIDAEWFLDQLKDSWRQVEGLTVGWHGGARLDEDLEQMASAWGRLAKRYPDVTFVTVGRTPKVIRERVPESRLWTIPWQDIEAWPRAISNIDIACCAVAPNDWNRRKTPIKVWESALAGACVVASHTLYSDVVTDEVDGFLADGADAWETALSIYIDHELEREEKFCRQFRRTLREHSLTTQLQWWPEAWAALVGQRQAVAV